MPVEEEEATELTAVVDQVLVEEEATELTAVVDQVPVDCLLYTSPSPRDATLSRMPSSA